MSGRSGSASSATRATGKVAPAASTEGPSLHSEADLQAHLEVGDAAVGDLAADLLGLEPLDVAHRLGGLADRVPDGVVDAGLAAAHDLAQPVHVVAHGSPPDVPAARGDSGPAAAWHGRRPRGTSEAPTSVSGLDGDLDRLPLGDDVEGLEDPVEREVH